MQVVKRIFFYSFIIFVTFSSNALKAQTDTIQYLFMGHPRLDDRENEFVLKTVENLDYSKFELLLIGGDLTWHTSELTSTLEYMDCIFDLGGPNTFLAMGNHDNDNLDRLLSYTKKDRFYSFSRNNLTFIVLDTELSTPSITGAQLDIIKTVADTIKNSDYLVIVHHRIIWMADNPDLAHLKDSVAASSKNLSSSNFFPVVYPELQKVKNKGIPVYCIAGDRTNINIEYSKEDSIQFIASGMVGTYPDSANYTVVLTHIPNEHLLTYEFVPLSEMDTIKRVCEPNTSANNISIDCRIYPNPCSNQLFVQLSEPMHNIVKAELISPFGKKIFETNIPQDKKSILFDTSSLKSGLYIIRISDNQKSYTKKLFVVDK